LSAVTIPPASNARHLYLHIPYCAAKCPYCDFNSIAGREDEFESYVDALLEEVGRLPVGPYETVFIGGGTPTILGPQALERLLAGIRDHIHLAANYEWTCEANPGSSDAERFALLAEHGVNRISLGVQAVQDHHLRFLGRVHDLDQARGALALAKQAVPRVSADLIIGLPGQTRSELAATIAFIGEHELEHASVYHLAIEAGTEFHARYQRGELQVLDQDTSRDLLEQAWSGLAALGLEQYETSNFARPGAECRHNLAYWRQRDYQAAGCGAVSTLAGQRMTREKHPGRYIAAIQAGGDAAWQVEALTQVELIEECWMLGLRLADGVDLAALQALGDASERWHETAVVLARQGLIQYDGSRLALSPEGRAVQDAVTVALMPG
jgi:putative oxygen-independent coproporphyrinogen III oxidase